MNLYKAKVGGSGGGSIQIEFSAKRFTAETYQSGMHIGSAPKPKLYVQYLKEQYKYAKLISKGINDRVSMGSTTNAPVGYVCPTSDLGTSISASSTVTAPQSVNVTVEFYN